MQKFLPIFSLIILFSCAPENKSPDSPNIIIIFTDDQGYQDVGCFGSPDILTPNLDKLASEGVKLTSFYSAQAVCSASRAALLTGCYPNRLGIHGAYMPESKKGLHPNEETIAEMLKKKGYNTAVFGKWHLGDEKEFLPLQQGFDEYFGIPYSNDMWPLHPGQGKYFNFGPLPLYENNEIIDTLVDQSLLTTQITERSINFISRNKNNPFFLYVPHPQPHVPLFVSDKFKGKSERGLYGDVIMEIDWSVGKIMEALKSNNIVENTIIIFTSDNGPWLSYGKHAGSALPFREGKGTAWEGGHREPFIIRYPEKLNSGKTIDLPVMAIDIFPTLAYLTNSDLPKNIIDGKNVWEIISGKSKESKHDAYFFYYKTNELHGVRYKNWKMYFPHVYRTLNGKEGRDDGIPINYESDTLYNFELYNVVEDISETNNIASDNPKVIETIMYFADSIRVELGDNLTNVVGIANRQVGHIDSLRK